jgi:hypothetical protein
MRNEEWEMRSQGPGVRRRKEGGVGRKRQEGRSEE